ncbi:MAG: outer membrane protein assembly factor BamA [Nitrospirae bacterium]|nr:outer membrane protein assembly factor BamA [Nitrospirota bacterium]
MSSGKPPGPGSAALVRILSLLLLLQTSSVFAQPLSEFEVVPEDPLLRAQIETAIREEGLDQADPESLQRLQKHLEERFPDLRFTYIERVPGPRGAFIRIHAARYDVIIDMVFHGHRAIRSGELQSALRLKKGELFSPEKLGGAEEALRQVYASYGFYHAEISTRTEKTQNGVIVHFDIEENRRAVLNSLTCEGELQPYSQAWIRGASRLRRRDPYSEDAVYRGVREIRRAYFRKKRFGATVEPRKEINEAGDVDLTLVIHSGKPFELVFQGDPRSRDRDLLGFLQLEKMDRYDAGTLEGWAASVKDGLQKRGYAFAKVTLREQDSPEVRYLVFQVDTGDKVAIRSVQLEGNVSFKSRRITQLLQTRKASRFPLLAKGTLVESDLKRDHQRIVDFYKARGFLDARVLRHVVEKDLRQPYLDVTFVLQEGRQARVGRVEFDGVPDHLQSGVAREIQLKTEAPFNPVELKEDELKVLTFMTAHGYLDAIVNSSFAIEGEPPRARIRMRVMAGEPSYVGRIVLQRIGEHSKTHDRVVLREIKLATGQLVDQQKVAEGQLRVFRLGFFREVQVRPSSMAYMDAEGRSLRDIVIAIEERKSKEIAFGPGYDTDNEFGGFVEGGLRNLFGTGRALSARGQFTQKDRFYRATYSEPWIFDFDLTLRSTASYEKDVDTAGGGRVGFDRSEYALTVGTEKRFDNLTVTLQQRVARTFRTGEKVRQGEVDDKTLKSFLTPGMIYDRRDDFFNPRTGYLLSSTVDFAPMFLGSEVEFIRPTARASRYFNPWGQIVLASGLRASTLIPLTGLGTVSREADEELLRLGGRDSLRGFGQSKVGIPHVEPSADDADLVETRTLGGSIAAHASQEFRFPIPTILPFKMGGVLFADAGNVWRTPGQGDANNGFEVRTDAGFALRIITPIGPISGYVAFNLQPKELVEVKTTSAAEQEAGAGAFKQVEGMESPFQIGFAIGEFF